MAPRTWGYWTEYKLDLLSKYLLAFTRASKRATATVYMDLFAGQPENESRVTGLVLDGSARRALDVSPPFSKVVLFELPGKAKAQRADVTSKFPGRDIAIYEGDCNRTIDRALRDLAKYRLAATFAFVDQQGTEVAWETLAKLAAHKKGSPYKVELWVLFAHAQLPRGLGVRRETDKAFAESVDRMFGSTDWRLAYTDRIANKLTPEEFRDELTNCFRWRLATELRYRFTHAFELKNTDGKPLYTMVFATDNATGDKIMGQLYGKATEQSEGMRQEALALRQGEREKESGTPGLFDPLPRQVVIDASRLYVPTPHRVPYGFVEADVAEA